MSEAKQAFLDGLNTIKTLTGVSQADFDTLKKAEPEASQWVDEVAQFFYDTLFAHARTAAVFHDGERPAREKTLKAWYLRFSPQPTMMTPTGMSKDELVLLIFVATSITNL